MEMINKNIDFDKVLMAMTPDQIAEWEEKAKHYKQKTLDRRVAELESWKKKCTSEMELLIDKNKELEKINSDLQKKVDTMKISTDKVTETLLTHGREKRDLDKYINLLVYKELTKDSLRDELFHGHLTSCCKRSICESLNVGAIQWIEVNDVDMSKKLAFKFLNKTTIHSLMRKYARKLEEQYEKSKMDNKKESISLGKARKFELLELLIEEVGGNIDEI